MERLLSAGGSASDDPLVALVTPQSAAITSPWTTTASHPTLPLFRIRHGRNEIEEMGGIAAQKGVSPYQANYDKRSEAYNLMNFDDSFPFKKQKTLEKKHRLDVGQSTLQPVDHADKDKGTSHKSGMDLNSNDSSWAGVYSDDSDRAYMGIGTLDARGFF